MTTTSEAELYHALPGWQRYGNRIEKTFDFDDFSAAARSRTSPPPPRCRSPAPHSLPTASLWRSLLGTVAP